MTPTRVDLTAPDGVTVAAYRWDDVESPRGIVQITHGMGEHALRYTPLATALNAHGFVVYAQDHRGHGATAASPARYGQLGAGGWEALVADIGLVRARAADDNPDLPLVLLGHSMGSFAVQQYLPDHAAGLRAVVLSGTAAIDLLEPALDLDGPVDLSAFNAPFAPARTDFDWLSRDPEQVDLYVADERCGFGLDADGGKAMFVGARRLADPAALADVPADLPIYIAVGELDPVNGQLALVHPLVQRYRDAGLTDVTLRTYPEARHEIFNETNRDEVVDDLVRWLDGRV